MTGFLFLCFFLSGATALVYEVVFLRMLGLVFGHTVHAVATVLIVFMGGLALGSAVFGGLTPRIRRPIQAYGWLELGTGAGAVLRGAPVDPVRDRRGAAARADDAHGRDAPGPEPGAGRARDPSRAPRRRALCGQHVR